ncbi:MAG: hypothetical protein ACOVO1_03155 [Chitinophagaceae bacterium]
MFAFSGSQKIILAYLAISFGIMISGADFSVIPASFFFVWLINLIYNVNDGFLIRHIFVLFYSLQYALGSTLSYSFNTSDTYRMVVPANEYFSYAFPAILFLSLGLFYKTSKSNEDKAFSNVYSSLKNTKVNEKLLEKIMYISLFVEILNIPFPEVFDFLRYIICSFKYAYVCYHIITKEKINYGILLIPILTLIYKTLITAMFHDLVTWFVFWGLSVCVRYKPSRRTIVTAGSCFIFSVLVLQLAKSSYREKAWGLESGKQDIGIASFSESITSETKDGGLSVEKLSESIVRINQGWILCRVMDFVPRYVDHEGLELFNKYIEAAFLPRAFAPNKLSAGDKDLFNKYTGLKLTSATSMGLGLVADAWISYGKEGGWLLLFIYGIFIGLTLKYAENLITKYPYVFFFLPVIYIYPIRPDCETQTSLGHLVKTLFLITILAYRFFPKNKQSLNLANAVS